MLYYVIIIGTLISITSSHSPVNFIHPCSELTPACLKDATQKAIPGFVRGVNELGIETLDPFRVDNLELTLPGGLRMLFKNGTSRGFRKSFIEYASLDNDVLTIKLRMNLTIKGEYRSSGRLLLFPIDGEGNANIRCANVFVAVKIKLATTKGLDGKKHLEVKNYMTKHRFDGRVFYELTNLFKGNPEISKLVSDFLNNNWKMVAEELGTPIVQFTVDSVMKNIKQLFKVLPIDELIKAPINF